MSSPPRVGMLSLEPWDLIWRRNQHLASRLVASGAIKSLVFVTPPAGGLAIRALRASPLDRIEVVTPPLVVPRRFGGHRMLGAWLRRALADVDVLWINDPVAGSGALRHGVPAVYDVTDDWREMAQAPSERARLVAAEDALARVARIVVCSGSLAERWQARYGVKSVIVRNGVDADAVRRARPQPLDGDPPHALYVGTLHANRIDVDLIMQLARDDRIGTVHLVGPGRFAPEATERFVRHGVRLHGPVPAVDVPGWLVAADVLICPHLVDEFTLSLDAIKSHEYLATRRPVVATPSSGFQELSAPGLTVVDRSRFVAAVAAAARSGPFDREPAASWDDRARQFEDVLNQLVAP